MVLYCLHIMYKYYYPIGFSPIKDKEEGKNIHNEIFNKITFFIKNHLHAYFLQYGFVINNNKLIH